ncbi:hypothetical protein MTBBW1_2710011 [Desulfamplus magnetovallimortis]|uniref:Uncharacterized protein n=2 Tax=Desulfamplus magnetovallimortis TaxID=1246637 RepID=A0A1W1HF52_9BACT|nr:hypothetical protein MTBBW1_2710011 [Desulfamplus magnetovallimortis]
MFANTLAEATQPYSAFMRKETLLTKKHTPDENSHTSHLTKFKNKRLAITSELGKNDQLDESIIKKMSGNDAIQTRGCYSDNEDNYTANFVTVAISNYIEPFHNLFNSEAFMDRLKIIEFPVKFRGTHKDDKNIRVRLHAEHQGICCQIVKWCKRFHEEGGILRIPDSIIENTKNILGPQKCDRDYIDDFIQEKVKIHDRETCIKPNAIFWAYNHFMEKNQFESVLTRKKFMEIFPVQLEKIHKIKINPEEPDRVTLSDGTKPRVFKRIFIEGYSIINSKEDNIPKQQELTLS